VDPSWMILLPFWSQWWMPWLEGIRRLYVDRFGLGHSF
jgi:hypothetical protein